MLKKVFRLIPPLPILPFALRTLPPPVPSIRQTLLTSRPNEGQRIIRPSLVHGSVYVSRGCAQQCYSPKFGCIDLGQRVVVGMDVNIRPIPQIQRRNSDGG